MSQLQRLSGAKKVAQDDFNKGVGKFTVSFDQPPATTVADVKKEMGKYKLDKVEATVTSKVTEKDKAYHAGTLLLINPKSGGEDVLAKLGELLKTKKGALLVLTGVLGEDDKGRRQLELTKFGEADKAKK